MCMIICCCPTHTWGVTCIWYYFPKLQKRFRVMWPIWPRGLAWGGCEPVSLCHFVNFFLMFISERETDRQNASWGRAEREGNTESKAGSRLWAVSAEPDAGPEPMNREIMTWAEVGHLTSWATQAPLNKSFNSHCGKHWISSFTYIISFNSYKNSLNLDVYQVSGWINPFMKHLIN